MSHSLQRFYGFERTVLIWDYSFAALCILKRKREILWMARICRIIADSTGFELSRHMFSLKHLVSGQRINEVKDYVPPDVIAVVEAKEEEIL